MPVKDKLTKEGKWLYKIRPYIHYEDGTSKQTTIHGNWIGLEGKKEASKLENILSMNVYQIGVKWNKEKQDFILPNSLAKEKVNADLSLEDVEKEYLEFSSLKVDKDTLDYKKKLLDHFCQLDKTHQVRTFPNKNIKEFNENLYYEWKKEMIKKTYEKGNKKYLYKIKYLNRIHNEICNMIDYAILKKYCNINFAKLNDKFGTVKEQRLSNYKADYETINYNEYTNLLKVSENDLRYNTYFDLEFKRGPRTGEIRAFRICDYNSKKKQLMVNHTMNNHNELKEPKTPASKAPIDLPYNIDKKIKKIILNLSKQDGFNDEWYIFGGKTPISRHALDNAKNKYLKKAGICKHIRLHDFRHSCATWLFSIGIPVTVISKILRHSSVDETLKTYIHLVKDDYYKYLLVIDNYSKQDQKQDQYVDGRSIIA